MASISKLSSRTVASGCLPGRLRVEGIGASDAVVARAARPVGTAVARPVQAPAVAAARVDVYAAANALAARGAAQPQHQIFGQQKTQLHSMWALRGLHPWSDPA